MPWKDSARTCWRGSTRLLLLETHRQPDGRHAVLAVVEGPADQVRPMAERLLRESFGGSPQSPALELLDRNTYDTIRRLADAGLLKIEGTYAQTLHASPSVEDPVQKEKERRRQVAQSFLADARRKGRMAKVLREGGFPCEALGPLREGVDLALKAAACAAGRDPEALAEGVPVSLVESCLVQEGLLPEDAVGTIAGLRQTQRESEVLSDKLAASLLGAGEGLIEHAERAITARSL
jgi:hypothetical protein